MITLIVHEARTAFEGPEHQLELMFEVLRVKDKNSWWRAKAMLRKQAYVFSLPEDEKKEEIERINEDARWIKFYDRRTDTFATGLLPRVKKFLRSHEVKLRIEDKRKKLPVFRPIKKFHFQEQVETRTEQLVAVNAALIKGRGILHCATNAGKTIMAAAIISEYKRQVCR